MMAGATVGLLLGGLSAAAVPHVGIVNGQRVPQGALPFLTALRLRAGQPGSGGQNEQYCGGALIGPRHVLTAGHCGFVYPPMMAASVVGAQHTSDDEYACWSKYLEVNVSGWKAHPNFTEPPKSMNTMNDIAIVELSTPVTGVKFAQIPKVDIEVGTPVW